MNFSDENPNNVYAPDSISVKRAREKLEKQIASEKLMVTDGALKKVSNKMRMWITRHSSERVPLKDKDITIFDGNKHKAKVTSPFINRLRSQINRDLRPAEESEEPISLEGRISTQSLSEA